MILLFIQQLFQLNISKSEWFNNMIQSTSNDSSQFQILLSCTNFDSILDGDLSFNHTM